MYERALGDGPLVVSFPHSGTALPNANAARMTAAARATLDTDWYVDRLYGFANALGATTLRANVSRYVVDLNRDPSGASLYPGQRTTGVCPVETFEGDPLYAAGREPSETEIASRVEAYWLPYHRELRALLDRAVDLHGYALLIDGHSIWGRLPLLFDGELPDVNLGTNAGASCAAGLAGVASVALAATPYSVVIDGRFKGGYITRHYGEPDRGVHAVQIELNQHTYLRAGTRTGWDDAKAAALADALERACTAMLYALRGRPATTTPAQTSAPSA